MKAEDARSAAFDILGTMDNVQALELIRTATNSLHLPDNSRLTIEWGDDLDLSSAPALVLMMRAHAMRLTKIA